MRFLIALGAFLLLADTVAAHSLKSLENKLASKERYFQALDEKAPDFSLQDADGRPVALRNFKGKVVVFHFIYTIARMSVRCMPNASREFRR